VTKERQSGERVGYAELSMKDCIVHEQGCSPKKGSVWTP